MRIYLLIALFIVCQAFTLDSPQYSKSVDQPLVLTEGLHDVRSGRLSVQRELTDTVPNGTNIDFEHALKKMRFDLYYHPKIDIIKEGFRPVGGSLADFAVGWYAGRLHVFYIERRLQEGTPFFPGHEVFFGHASTANFFDWEVHNPVLYIRPGTWEDGHVWAPCILKSDNTFIMAYTGLNQELSQDIGLATSSDMVEWKRSERNPISPLKNSRWAAWWPDDICSCRDPNLVRHEGLIYMVLTANTKAGATCIALFSTMDFKTWKDNGPILIGPEKGYEAKLWGGHPQGSLESANLSFREAKWRLIANCAIRNKGRGSWIWESGKLGDFRFEDARSFWPGAGCIESVADRGTQTLLAGLADGGRLKFGIVDWSSPMPVAHFATDEELKTWKEH